MITSFCERCDTEILYEGGTVSYLNDGYEILSKTRQRRSGFISMENGTRLSISGVTFTKLVLMANSLEDNDSYPSVVSVRDLTGGVAIKDCAFNENLMEGYMLSSDIS